jgi:hypothetical protein
MVDVVDLVCVDTHVIARLKIADLCRTARNAYVFRRLRGRDSGDGLVARLNDDVALSNTPQYPSERHPGLVSPAIRRLMSRSALRIRSAWISATGIFNAGISNAGSDDLAKTGNSGQQEKGQ